MMGALHKLLLFCLLTYHEHNALGSEIIHGKKAPDNLMLYMASLQNDAGRHVCGGFLINDNFVLSAAHCNNSVPTSVVLGTHDLKRAGNKTARYSVKTCVHPSFKNVKSGADIMLLKLLKKAQLSKSVQTVKLPRSQVKLKDNAKCRVAGWGRKDTGGESVNVLEVVEVPVVNGKTCEEMWKGHLPPNVICAGGYKTDKGFCQGDSGGPLVCGGEAVGVVSFNHRRNCAYPNYPNVYTDISKYLPWIKEALKKKSC